MHRGMPLFLNDNTDAYTIRQGNDHYVYHNVVVTAGTPNECSASTATRECLLEQKRAHEVCKPTGGSILAREDRV